MATTSTIDYPTGDGRPLAETPVHQSVLIRMIHVLDHWFEEDSNVYVAGNMLMYYVEGNPRQHVSPDVFVTLGIPKDKRRDAYFTWEEGGRGPDLVIEVTSKSTRREDQRKKHALYRDVLRVREYYLFDPRGEYLKPRLQGFRLQEGQYVPMEAVDGRLPSEVLEGPQFEAVGEELQIYNPATGKCLLTKTEAELARSEEERLREREGRLRAEQEAERLRRRLAELERQQGGNGRHTEDDA
ncbi:MAG TPA: Uma2 family endonuclease [Pirellulales bacterium]|nr:Uma2 family endonuclease [Pirellulales bacterium]